jgi:hypothetical protein
MVEAQNSGYSMLDIFDDGGLRVGYRKQKTIDGPYDSRTKWRAVSGFQRMPRFRST